MKRSLQNIILEEKGESLGLEVTTMRERMTWSEIKEKYPEQWIGLVDIDWENGATVRSAVVKYIGKSSDELLKIKFNSEPDLVARYTSPDSLGPMGIVGGML